MSATLDPRSIDWAEVEDFFYQEMLAGWAADAATSVDTLNGFKSITSGPAGKHGTKYLLVDRWATFPGSTRSTGMTLIYRKMDRAFTTLIWTMSYGGSYSKRGAKVVRAALSEAYRRPEKYEGVPACGCRGSLRMFADTLLYRNEVRPRSTFRSFGGREDVVDLETGEKSEGYHEYFGGSMF